jgi:NhaP-type Na+/H+ or K+/H+ antiporter
VPTVEGGIVVSWCGMRGIVTLAAAYALPEGFPYRDLILLTAFAVVLGSLVIQGCDRRTAGRSAAAARDRRRAAIPSQPAPVRNHRRRRLSSTRGRIRLGGIERAGVM